MKRIFSLIALLSLLTLSAYADGTHKVWELETKDDVDTKWFIEDGKYFFVRAAEYIHFFDGENGKELYNLEIADFEKQGIDLLWNEKQYIISTENEELVSYDVYTGKIQWQQKYADIDQADYTDYDNTEAGVIIYYDDIALCVELATGKELWRHTIKYDGNRVEKGLPVLWWTHSDDPGYRFLFATSDGLLLLDAKTGAELWKTELDLTDIEEVEAVTFYNSKALLMYDDDKLGFLDLKSGKELWNRPQDIGDIEGYSTLENLGGTNYLLLSADDKQIMINLTSGAVQWEKTEEELDGILTAYKVYENGAKTLVYFKRKHVMGSGSGTHLDLALIETTTGKIVYKKEIAMTTYAPIEGIANFLSSTLLGAKAIRAHDYFFVFDEYEVEGDIVFLIRGTAGASGMCNPETRDGDGEGLVRINPVTGEIKYRSYFPLNSVGFRWSAVNFSIDEAPQPTVQGNSIYIVGAERVVCADLKTGKVNWKIDEDLGFPTRWFFHDNTIFLKVGKQAFNVSVDAKSGDISASKAWNKDPYRIYAINPTDGKIIWNIEFENDPGLGMDIIFDEASKTLYGADEEELFAVRLSRDAAGKKLWTFNFEKDGKIGELEHDECYAVARSASSSTSYSFNMANYSSTTTTTTSYSASAELVLQPVFRGDHFTIFGPDGVCSVGLDGKLQWTTEWNWAGKKVTLKPEFLKTGYIAYMVKEDIQLLDEKTGQLYWKEEDDDDAKPLLAPNNKYLYMLEDDEVRVYRMAP